MTPKQAAALIDHTLLRPDAVESDVMKVCAEAKAHGFASVCVNSCWVPVVARELAGTAVKVCSVIGFPLGAMLTSAKVSETAAAVTAGASEIDMVQNVGWLRAGALDAVRADIAAVVGEAGRGSAIVKVILETSLLTQDQKVIACRLAQEAGAAFVKTSTGFGSGGATEDDVALMRAAVGATMGVKASGGIRTLADVERMVAAGATRIGASAGVSIVQSAELSSTDSY